MTTNNNMEMTLLPKRSSSGADVSISRTSQDGRTSNDGFDTRVEGKGNVSDFAAPEIQPGHTQPGAFFKLFSLWIGTVILTALVVTIVMVYRAKGILTPAEKDIYNTVSTVLILVLGLSFFEAFKELARAVATKGILIRLFNPKWEEAKLMKDFDSLLNVARLTYTTSNWWLRLFCIIWLSVNFAAQMLSALISLECTVDDGNNYNSTYTTNGSVRVPRLGCYYSGDICSKNPVSTGARAHAYGEMTLSPDCGRYSEIADILHSKYEYPSYCRQDLLEFSYRFFEYNRDDTQEAFPHFTNRIITAASGDCIEYDQVGDHGNVKLGDTSAWNFTYTNNTINDSIAIPVASLGTGGTTYIYRDKNVPAEASTEAYGDRGLWMWAYKNAGGPEKPKFYQCPVTVSVVSNVTQPAHDLSDEVARVAVASIALQGQWHQGTLKHPIWSQYQFYAMGSSWEIHGHPKERVGANIAEFAMSSIVTMIHRNKPTYIEGTLPHLGSRLNVKWKAFIAVLICIVATHFTIFTLTYFVTQRLR